LVWPLLRDWAAQRPDEIRHLVSIQGVQMISFPIKLPQLQ
jgi:hypothetical protein